jgi:hypothetical protein
MSLSLLFGVVASVPSPELEIEADEPTPAPKFIAEPANSEEPVIVVEKLEASSPREGSSIRRDAWSSTRVRFYGI